MKITPVMEQKTNLKEMTKRDLKAMKS